MNVNMRSKPTEIYIHYMHFRKFLCTKIRLRPGVRSEPRWGSFQSSPNLPDDEVGLAASFPRTLPSNGFDFRTPPL